MLRGDRSRLGELLTRADQFEPRHRGAVIHGLLDAADGLEEPGCRRLVRRGLRVGQAAVRRTALDRLCELDGPESARRRARADGNASVRRWQPKQAQLGELASLFEP